MPVAAGSKEGMAYFHIALELRWLDAATPLPQLIISGYTGGAHCCTVTEMAWAGSDGEWRTLGLGEIDGEGYNLLDINSDGTTELVDAAPGFIYSFASHGGSYSPTRIQYFQGGTLHDGSFEPRFHEFQMRELRDMERTRAKYPGGEPNGFLAGWVAQSAIVGQLSQAWRLMMSSYDHTKLLTDCRVDKRDWQQTSHGLDCPPGQQRQMQFPEALAHFLVEQGYISAAQSAALGFDEGQRLRDIESSSRRYESDALERWFLIDNEGDCAMGNYPSSSPAARIESDRTLGLEDQVITLAFDAGNEPVAVRVDTPKGQSLVATTTFYRGLARCLSARASQKSALDKMR